MTGPDFTFTLDDSIYSNLQERTATLLIGNKKLKTPCCHFYTSLGSIPHLTCDQVSLLNNFENTFSFSVALESFLPLVIDHENQKTDHRHKREKLMSSEVSFRSVYPSLKEYLALPKNALLITDLRDIYEWVYQDCRSVMTKQFASTSTLSR
jgi:hypothetical protein